MKFSPFIIYVLGLGLRTLSMAESDFTHWSILLTLYINLKMSDSHANFSRLKNLWARLNQLLGVVGYCKGTWAKGQLLVFLVVLRCQEEGEHHGGMTSPLSELRILLLKKRVVITGQVCKCLLHTCTYFKCFRILAGDKMIRDST